MALPAVAAVAIEAGVSCALNKACRTGVVSVVKSSVNSLAKSLTGKTLFNSAVKNSMIKKADDVIEAEIISTTKKKTTSNLMDKLNAVGTAMNLINAGVSDYQNSDVEEKFDNALNRSVQNTIQTDDYKHYDTNSIPNPYADVQSAFKAKQYTLKEIKTSSENLLDVINKQTKEFSQKFQDLKTSHEDAIIALVSTQAVYLEQIANKNLEVKSPSVNVNPNISVNPSLKVDKPVEVVFPAEFMNSQSELLNIEKDRHKFEITDISIKDLEGNEVIKTSPQMVNTMCQASVLQSASDENNFELDDDDLEFMQDDDNILNALFNPVSKHKFFTTGNFD